MAHRLEYQRMAYTKIKEAKALLRNRHLEGAHYMAGYALEFSLKAAVCKHLDIDDFFIRSGYVSDNRIWQSYKTHAYKDLLVLAGLINKIEDYKATDQVFSSNWSFINRPNMSWSEQCRYLIRTQADNNILIEADVKKYISALDDKKGGFLRWIKRHW